MHVSLKLNVRDCVGYRTKLLCGGCQVSETPACINESCVIQVDVRTLQQQSVDSVPLLGGDKGAKDDRGEEEDEEEGGEPSSEGADR